MSAPLTGRMDAAPSATYRLQLRPGFGFDAAADVVPYLAELGVSHLYLSPVLQAVPGSAHGYDVVDHTVLSADLGGREGFRRLRAAAREHGLGLVVDIVPNHMALPTPESLNRPFWSLLREGPRSEYARWFDVDWEACDNSILLPVLGDPLEQVIDRGELGLEHGGDEPVLRYFDHAFPVRAGTTGLPLPELLARQWYRLAYWRDAATKLNYRRFFDIDTLVALRVEDPEVFAATHSLVTALVREGIVDGLRVDHPDGLADPAAYLTRLQEATGGCWVVAEKITTGEEELPAEWACAGSTGYDALRVITGVLCDPAGEQPLTRVWNSLTGEDAPYEEVIDSARRLVVTDVLTPEVGRLTELAHWIAETDPALPSPGRPALEHALRELLAGLRVYRAYVTPGQEPDLAAVTAVEQAAARAVAGLTGPAEHAALTLLVALALGRCGRDADRDEFVLRFGQTTGPVAAKGVEDTAHYRWLRMPALNEVGLDPAEFGVEPAAFHAFCARVRREWPGTMTTLTTHDTKRSEDVRARLLVTAEIPLEWDRTVEGWRRQAARHRGAEGWPDAATEYLLWQTLFGTWPIERDRLSVYLLKAVREAKTHTSWTDPDEPYEEAVAAYADSVLADGTIRASVESFVARTAPYARSNSLSQKLLQLAMPGVPDTYQGAEFTLLTLVDPDNRRPVDFPARQTAVAALLSGEEPKTLDEEKALVTLRALRLRRDHPDIFGAGGDYTPLPATGSAARHAIGFLRSDRVAAVATRLPVGLEQAGGWHETAVRLPPGPWTDVLTGRAVDVSPARPGTALSGLLDRLPVALLVRG